MPLSLSHPLCLWEIITLTIRIQIHKVYVHFMLFHVCEALNTMADTHELLLPLIYSLGRILLSSD